MTRPWKTLASVSTREGALELRQRADDDFLILIAGRVLMTSKARRSEEVLATLGCAAVAARPAPRVLIGGLGMGYTLRAALDALPAGARVTMVELTAEVEAWCRGPLAPLTNAAVADSRVKIVIADVARVIAEAKPGGFDAILLDLYEGAYPAQQRREDPHFGPTALARTRSALASGGVVGVWAEDPDPAFPGRLGAAGFEVTTHRAGRGGRRHVVYLGRRG
jgi:spermidine synthase